MFLLHKVMILWFLFIFFNFLPPLLSPALLLSHFEDFYRFEIVSILFLAKYNNRSTKS